MKQEHKIYLDAVRESGKINMFAVTPFLQNEFGVDKLEAREILAEWMHSYK